ncbi:MAG TPA: hypothetical protein DCS85_03280 [Verrucomicrobiales bacterium]|jgi:hypothetical protein|nr:hypothetical protein [Verrucomicrobiales bacterium]
MYFIGVDNGAARTQAVVFDLESPPWSPPRRNATVCWSCRSRGLMQRQDWLAESLQEYSF